MSVERLIRRPVRCLPPEASCQDAAKLMQSDEIGSIVVVADGRPAGIVTDRDLVTRVLATGKAPEETSIGSIMSRAPIFLEGDRNIQRAIETMKEFAIRRLIVVDEEGFLEGLVSLDDLLQILARDLQALAGSATTPSAQ
jgi:CBS domain-containing protein